MSYFSLCSQTHLSLFKYNTNMFLIEWILNKEHCKSLWNYQKQGVYVALS